MNKEYKTVSDASGPLIVVKSVSGVKSGELAQIELQNGEKRIGKVLELDNDKALVQVYQGTGEMNIKETKVRFLGRSLELGLSLDMLGRTFDGMGKPIDGGPRIIPEVCRDINGKPVNPLEREYPSEIIQTGISAIDSINTLACGQKLSVFSSNGLPHLKLGLQIANQSKRVNSNSDFAVVFAGIGITFEESQTVIEALKESGTIKRSVMFLNNAADSAIERILTPRMALTTAEYLAFEKDMDVIVIIFDMINYANALMEVSAARKEVPSRQGYPVYMYSDFSSLYERAGRIKNKAGSITLIPLLTMIGDDITHPASDISGYLSEGQIVLSKELYKKGVVPPIDVFSSMSRTKEKIINNDLTKKIISVYYEKSEFAKKFEQNFISQGFESDRTIEETLTILNLLKKEYEDEAE